MEPPSSVPERSSYDASGGKLSALSEISSKEEVLLGVAEFDVSNLLRGFWEVKLTSSLIHPRNICCANVNDTNDDGVKVSRENSPIPPDILMSSCTSVKMKIRLAYNLQELQANVLRCDHILNRIFLNLTDLNVANNILNDVSSHNSSVLRTHQIFDDNANIQVTFLDNGNRS